MAKKPERNPTRLERQLPISRVDEHRHVDRMRKECEWYNSCLSHAAKNNWPAFSCAKCPLAPDEMRIRENAKPDLRPIPALEEPPPAVSNVGDLASVMKLWQDRERARLEDEALYEVDDDRDRRDLPHYIVADPGSRCSDCGEMFGEEDPACYCDYCQAVVCETCRETHRCTVPG